MRKKLLLFLCVLVVLAAGVLAAVLLGPRSDGPVSRARCGLVQVGMTQAEVEAILGGPPGDYQTGEMKYDPTEMSEFAVFVLGSRELGEERDCRSECWKDNQGVLWVRFDERGLVVNHKVASGRRVTVLDKLRGWLGL